MIESILARMTNAPSEYGMMPFWFWNDDLNEEELLRQLRAFHAGGLGGIVIHPRIGLSPNVGYLTDTYFRYVRLVADECARLGMKIILYDEGSYPSGSACGAVVTTNPGFAARGLTLSTKRFHGPLCTYWRPTAGRSLLNRLLCVVLARLNDETCDPTSLQLLEIQPGGLVRLEIQEGQWLAMAVFDVPSGGTIRGVLPEHEDGSALAPAAGDILNPDAVATFIALTHEAYARHLADHLGTTVIGVFTDEPHPLGRSARRGVMPYTPGLETWLAAYMNEPNIKTWLPSLWIDYGPDTDAFRRSYAQGIVRRLEETFYSAQAAWCDEHGLVLTGHPSASNDMASLRSFHWPGQDTVWRWVSPEDDSALVGPHSVAAKAATSAARAKNARRIATELFGAYGWRLSLDEAKWLIDWHLARGNNLFIPHALFYSIREGRAFESEPDVGIHNSWWPHFSVLANYTRQMAWALTDCRHVCQVGVAGPGHNLPWEAARLLYEHQIDFLYLDDETLIDATVTAEGLQAGSQTYRVVIVDGDLSPAATERLHQFAAHGGKVLHCDHSPSDLAKQIGEYLPPDVSMQPVAPTLRVIHVVKEGLHFYGLFNEGETTIEGKLAITVSGQAEWWDPLRQKSYPVHVAADAPTRDLTISVFLPRRESRLLVIDPSSPFSPPKQRPSHSRTLSTEVLPHSVTDMHGNKAPAPLLGDWTAVRELERFSGTLTYHLQVGLPNVPERIEIDLGAVGEAARIAVNGITVGHTLWAPYRVTTPGALWQAGVNRLEVAVTNSAANHFEGALRPSGLMDPVKLAIHAPTVG